MKHNGWYLGLISILILLLVTTVVSAQPTALTPTTIGNNNVTIPVTGCTGNAVWVLWGMNSGGEVWTTTNSTPDGSNNANVVIWGAPLTGNTHYVAQACDVSGCGVEIDFTTLPNTPVPTTHFGSAFFNITGSHLNPMVIGPNIFSAYFTLTPPTLFFGIFFGFIVLGFWRRTNSVRLVSIIMIILSPVILSSNLGLFFGVPLVEQALGQVLLACGVAGIMLSFVKK